MNRALAASTALIEPIFRSHSFESRKINEIIDEMGCREAHPAMTLSS
jgi:hypothetical protein